MTRILFVLIAEQDSLVPVFINMIILENIVCILMTYGYAIITIGVQCVIPEASILYPPAQEQSVTCIMVADAILNNGMVGTCSRVEAQTVPV